MTQSNTSQGRVVAHPPSTDTESSLRREVETQAAFCAGGTSASQSEPIFDCWNTIGVSGNGTCRELLRFTHCRNCPVHSAAAAQLLDRPVNPQWRDEWTEHFAKEKKLTTPTRTSVVIFRIGPEWLALPALAFQEVAERRLVHTLPHRRHGVVLGLVNIRGELLICVSLGRLLGVEECAIQSPVPSAAGAVPGAQAHPSSEWGGFRRDNLGSRLSERLLVTSWDSGETLKAVGASSSNRLVFPVDEVHGIRRVLHQELRNPPASSRGAGLANETPGTAARPSPSSTSGTFPWSASAEAGGRGWMRAVFRCAELESKTAQAARDQTVGLLDPSVLFATLNRQLAQ